MGSTPQEEYLGVAFVFLGHVFVRQEKRGHEHNMTGHTWLQSFHSNRYVLTQVETIFFSHLVTIDTSNMSRHD